MVINPKTAEELSAALYAISLHLLGGEEWRLCRPGRPDCRLLSRCFDFDVRYHKLIFSFWGEEFSQSWQVVGYEVKGVALRLHVAQQMGRRQATLELRPTAATEPDETVPAPERRRRFEKTLQALIEANLAGARVEYARTGRDDWRQLSGIYTRLIIDWRGRKIAGVGVEPGASQGEIDGLLGAGLVWFDRAAARLRGPAPGKLFVFAPEGRGTLTAERLTALCPAAPTELYEYDSAAGGLAAVRPFDQGDLAESLLRDYYWAEPAARDNPLTAEVAGLAPGLIETRGRIGYDSCSILGLEFARCYARPRPRVEFGVGGRRELLTAASRPRLAALVAQIARVRAAQSPERQHPFFTLQAERWLAVLLQRDITALDQELDGRFVYAQVPAYKGEDRGYVDLLAVRRDGRLVVIELKVSEDAELPLQGLDYWLRVEWHRRNGDLARRGYFPGVALAPRPPLLYLVAPLFRFHGTFTMLARQLSPQVPAWRVGINEHWREGVVALRRERVNEVQS